MVFTNLHNNTVSLVPFHASGIALRMDKVPCMPLNETIPFVIRDDDKDPRMGHCCDWFEHEEHENEIGCFCAPILAYVTDQNRLTVPSKFVQSNVMKRHHNALLLYEHTLFYVEVDLEPHEERADNNNHMNIKTNWRNIVYECDFQPNKTVRFKLIYEVPDVLQTVDPLDPVMIPLFHIC